MSPQDNPPPPYLMADFGVHSSSPSSGQDQPGAPTPSSISQAETFEAAADNNDGASSVSTSSSSGNVIYTPPETPSQAGSTLHGYGYHSPGVPTLSGAAVADGRPLNDTTDHIQAYFASRPPPPHIALEVLMRRVSLVSPGDDSSLVQMLLSGSSDSNRRHYLSEDLRVLAQVSTTPPQCQSSAPLYNPAWAHLYDITVQDWQKFIGHLQQNKEAAPFVTSTVRGEDEHAAAREQAKRVVRDWNKGFFLPRGVVIREHEELDGIEVPAAAAPASSADHPATAAPAAATTSQDEKEKARMLGAWDQPGSSRGFSRPLLPRPPFFEQEELVAQVVAGRLPLPQMNKFQHGIRGLHIGPLTIDDGRVAIGDSFQVDGSGIHWGNFSATRGQPPPPPPLSSASSSSSSSSSSSDSGSDSDDEDDVSIGSLMDWEMLQSAQLPVAKQSITEWLAHPEQPVTRAMLKTAKANIRAAANNSKVADPFGYQAAAPAGANAAAAHDQRCELQYLLVAFYQQRANREAARRYWRATQKGARKAHKAGKKAKKAARAESKRARKAKAKADRAGRRELKAKEKGRRGEEAPTATEMAETAAAAWMAVSDRANAKLAATRAAMAANKAYRHDLGQAHGPFRVPDATTAAAGTTAGTTTSRAGRNSVRRFPPWAFSSLYPQPPSYISAVAPEYRYSSSRPSGHQSSVGADNTGTTNTIPGAWPQQPSASQSQAGRQDGGKFFNTGAADANKKKKSPASCDTFRDLSQEYADVDLLEHRMDQLHARLSVLHVSRGLGIGIDAEGEKEDTETVKQLQAVQAEHATLLQRANEEYDRQC